MIASLVGAGLSAVGSIYGGIKASEAMKRAKDNIERQKADNEAWYNRRYNEDATQRADAMRIIAKTEEAIRNRNKQAAATAAVMGASEESVAATKAANAQATADAMSQIAVNADARKDQIESTYQQRNEAFDSQLEQQKAEAMGKAVQGMSNAGGNIASAF